MNPLQILIKICTPQHKIPNVSDMEAITLQNHANFSTKMFISVSKRDISQKYTERSRNQCNCFYLLLYSKHQLRTLLMTIYSQFTTYVSGNKQTPPITIFIIIADQQVPMEVDTCDSISIINWDTFSELNRRSCLNLSPAVSKLRIYSSEMVSPKGDSKRTSPQKWLFSHPLLPCYHL